MQSRLQRKQELCSSALKKQEEFWAMLRESRLRVALPWSSSGSDSPTTSSNSGLGVQRVPGHRKTTELHALHQQRAGKAMGSEIVYLMYHELEVPGRTVCSLDPGYFRYVVPLSDFAQQMEALKEDGWTGVSVGEALSTPADKAVVITFDDGCETDFVAAAPVLRSLNFNATFYITSGFVGARGYLTTEQLRELYKLGFEIGCHSMTHAYLPDLNDADLRHEIADSKFYLEDILDCSVTHFSCPGGRCNRRVKNAVRAAGYRSLATSWPHSNSTFPEPYALGRTVVMRRTPLPQFEALCRGRGLWKLSLRAGVYHGAMRILGSSFYDRVRGAVLSKVS